MTSLYPLKFKPIYKTKIWGGNKFYNVFNRDCVPSNCGESWEICDFDGNVSIVNNGPLNGKSLDELINVYKDDIVGHNIYRFFGTTFPLLIKFIDAVQNLSVQVHPNDTLARKSGHKFGKTEMWYVVQTDDNSTIISGFHKQVSKSTFLQAVEQNMLPSILQHNTTNVGDVFFIPAGCVHAIGSGNLILEIQQSSDITYRIFDYNRTDSNGNYRALHISQALEAIDYSSINCGKIKYSPSSTFERIIKCNFFTTNTLFLEDNFERNYSKIDSFVILICVEGCCIMKYNNTEEFFALTLGESILIPAIISKIIFHPVGKVRLIETFTSI